MSISVTLYLGLSLFAFSVMYDFTRFVYHLYIILCILIFSTVIAIKVVPQEAENKIRITTGIITVVYFALFSSFIVVDTQLMLGGKRRYMYYMDEHVLAVVHLLIDIVCINVIIIEFIGLRLLPVITQRMFSYLNWA